LRAIHLNQVAAVEESDAGTFHFGGEGVLVVVTEDAEDPVGGVELGDEAVGEGGFFGVIALVVDEVTGHEDDIRGFLADAGNEVVVDVGPEGAEMEVGDLDNAAAIEGGWQVRDTEAVAVPFEAAGYGELEPGAFDGVGLGDGVDR
jgi:hypothetical protein